MGERQAKKPTVTAAVQRLIKFNTFALSHGATTWEELPALADVFVDHWFNEHSAWCKSAKDRACVRSQVRTPIEQMLRLLLPDFVGTRRCKRVPFEQSVPDFFDYLIDERGLRPTTRTRYRHHLQSFEAYLELHGSLGLSDLKPALISSFIIERASQLSQGGIGGCSSVLRTFLRYLHRQGFIETDLARAISRGRTYRHSSIPRSISPDEVNRTLAAVDRRDALGKRDYAILLLLASYGLRAREIAILQLDDINWEQAELNVSARKNGHSTVYPLSANVGEAIIDYLRYGRPKVEYRNVFTNVMSPFLPISSRCISGRATKYIRAAGITVHRAGSHTFRHSCVQRLVDADVPFKVIGDFVGHQVPESTHIYAKVALHKLRVLSIGDAEDVL